MRQQLEKVGFFDLIFLSLLQFQSRSMRSNDATLVLDYLSHASQIVHYFLKVP